MEDGLPDGLPAAALLAGVGVAVAGAVAWALLLRFGDLEIDWLAIGIGGCIGLAIRSLGGRGAIAALAAVVLALGSLLGGKYVGYALDVPDLTKELFESAEGQALIREEYLMAKTLGRLAREHAGEPTMDELRAMVEEAYPGDPAPSNRELAAIGASLDSYRALEGPRAYDEYRRTLRDDGFRIFDPAEMARSAFGSTDLLFLAVAAATAVGAIVRG